MRSSFVKNLNVDGNDKKRTKHMTDEVIDVKAVDFQDREVPEETVGEVYVKNPRMTARNVSVYYAVSYTHLRAHET